MKTIVIYNSQTGFTKRYAPWITEADEEMIKMISSSYDISDKKYIEPILKCMPFYSRGISSAFFKYSNTSGFSFRSSVKVSPTLT